MIFPCTAVLFSIVISLKSYEKGKLGMVPNKRNGASDTRQMKNIILSLCISLNRLRCSVVAALLLLNFLSAEAQSLDDRINYGVMNTSLDEGLLALEKQSGLRVSFAVQMVQKYQHITIEKRLRTVRQTLGLLLNNTDLRYQMNGKGILIVKAKYIRGKVIDDKHHPIAFANVVLLDRSDSSFVQGVTSGDDGTFVLVCHSGENCILRCSFVGYETIFLNGLTENMGDVVLHDDAVVLKEVVVASERPTYRLTSEGLTVDVKNSLLSKAGTADDVLSQLPGVGGKDGKFTVFGKGTPQIYLNGRLVRDNTELGRLNSQDLKEVVVVRNPGAQYDAEVNSVILVRTIKRQIDNWSISFKQEIEQAHYLSFLDQLSWNYRKSGLDVFGTLYADNSHSWQKEQFDRILSSPSIWKEHREATINRRSHTYYLTAGLNEQFNDSNSIGLEYSYTRVPYAKMDINSSYDISSSPQGDGHIDDVSSLENPASPTHSLSTYYTGKVGRLGISFNGDYLYKKSSRNQDVTETSASFGNMQMTTFATIKSRLWASKFILTYPLMNGMLTGGYEYTNTHRSNDFRNEENILASVYDEVKEHNFASFLTYQRRFGSLGAQAGVRYEHVVSDYYDDGIRSEEQSRKYDNLFPNFSLNYKIGKVQTQLSYSMKTRRPSYYQLASNYQFDDRFYYQQGDPMLRPTNYLDFDLNVSYSWVNFSASYVNYKHVIFTVDKLYEKNPDIIVETYKNVDRFRSCYAMLTLSPKVGIWNPVYTFWFTKQMYDASQVNLQDSFETPRYYCQLRNTFQLPSHWVAALNYVFYGHGHDSSICFQNQQQTDFSLSKSFLKDRLTFHLQVFDIFGTNRLKYTIYTEHLSHDITINADAQSLRFTVSYQFNNVRSKYKGTGAGDDEKRRL